MGKKKINKGKPDNKKVKFGSYGTVSVNTALKIMLDRQINIRNSILINIEICTSFEDGYSITELSELFRRLSRVDKNIIDILAGLKDNS